MRAPPCSVKSRLASTTRSTASHATSSSTRRSAARCTSRSAAASWRTRRSYVPEDGLEKLAEVVVGYSTAVRPGDVVRIEGHPTTTPLIQELYRAVLRAGGQPVAQLVVDE